MKGFYHPPPPQTLCFGNVMKKNDRNCGFFKLGLFHFKFIVLKTESNYQGNCFVQAMSHQISVLVDFFLSTILAKDHGYIGILILFRITEKKLTQFTKIMQK